MLERLRQSRDWDRLRVMESRPAETEDLLRAHTPGHVENIRRAAEAGPTWIDGDTVVLPASHDVALRSAGASIIAAEAAAGFTPSPDGPLDAGAERDGTGSVFALIRPPGHHATADRAMGFCLFSNAAIAALYARERMGIERVAVFDWDVHHGNGTQDILYEDPSVLFISMHQWPLYPGTGWLDETGAGEGRGFNVNLPMPPGSGDREHLEAFDAVVGPVLDQFDPGLLIISAGQDGHIADELSHQMVTVSGYHRLASAAAGFARERGIGVAALHEGGYNIETLPRLDHAILAGLAGFPADLAEPSPVPEPGDIGWDERLAEIRRAQKPWWDV